MIGLSAAHCDTLLIEEQSREFPLSDFHSRFIEERRQRLSAGIPIKRGAMALISKARALSLPLAIVTSARREQARERLDGAAITPHLDLLITEADVAECKPHPEPYLAAARGLGVSPSRCLVVEDSPAGIASAQAAGMMVVMVPDLIQPDEETRSRCAEVLDDLFAVVRLVERAANAHENRPED
jgi:HAD superfamily hydrolase (TIGR01509 family)